MFGLDRLRESDIGSAHLKLERSAAAREIGFDPFELRFLPRGQVEFPVEKGVQFGLVRFRRIRHHAADENTSDGSGESDERDEKKAARRHRYRTSSKVEGASRSEEHTSELQSLMRISYAVFCLKK